MFYISFFLLISFGLSVSVYFSLPVCVCMFTFHIHIILYVYICLYTEFCKSITVSSCFGTWFSSWQYNWNTFHVGSISSNLALSKHWHQSLLWSSACIYAVSFSGFSVDCCLYSLFTTLSTCHVLTHITFSRGQKKLEFGWCSPSSPWIVTVGDRICSEWDQVP